SIAAPNVETQRHDILNDPLAQGEFDLVHTRWLLHHLPQPERALRHMLSAVRPGGWLLIEEVDFFPVHASSSDIHSKFMSALVNTVVEASGRDCFWARELPAMVAAMDVDDVGAEGDFSVIRGGSFMAEFFSLTAEQMRDRILQTGALRETEFDAGLKLLAS